MSELRRQFSYNVRPGTTLLQGEIAIGSGGAPTLTSGAGHGIKSVSRTAEGSLTVNLENPYLGLVGWHCSIENDGSLQDSYGVQLAGEWVAGVDTINEDTLDGVPDGYVKLHTFEGYGSQTVSPFPSAVLSDMVDHTLWLSLWLKTSEAG